MPRPCCRDWSLALLAALWVSFALPGPASAQNATVVMTAEKTEVRVGQRFSLRIRAEVEGSNAQDVEVPDLEGFRVVRHQISRPMQFRFGFGRGQQMVKATIVHRYVLSPTRTGRFELEPAKVRIGGRTFASNPLTIRVTEGGSASSGSGSGTGPAAGSGSSSSARSGGSAALQPPPDAESAEAPPVDGAKFDRRAFVRTVASKAKPWVGEQVNVTVYLYTHHRMRSSPVVTREPTTDGFWIHDLLPPSRNLRARRQRVRGRTFYVYVLRRLAAFPLESGELTIGPMELKLRSGSLFDLFQRRGRGPITRRGQPVTIDAQPLPDEDRRHVAVGDFELEMALERNQVPTGDAVTLKATVEGRGNLRDIHLDGPEMDGVRVLKPEVRDDIHAPDDVVRGKRVFEWLLVPEKPGEHRIAELGFEYFDPKTERYARAESEPLTLRAAGKPIGASAGAGGDADAGTGSQGGSGDAKAEFGPIRNGAELSRQRSSWPQPWYPFALAVPPVAWLGVLGAGVARRRLRAYDAASGPRRAARRARQHIARAEQHARENEPRAFYGEIAHGLKTMLEARLGEAVGGLTYDKLRAHLRDRGMEEDLVTRLIDELEGGDFARFSASGITAQEMDDCIARARALIDRLARFTPVEDETHREATT